MKDKCIDWVRKGITGLWSLGVILLGVGLRVCEKIRSWFDRLTTNGMVQIEILVVSRSS